MQIDADVVHAGAPVLLRSERCAKACGSRRSRFTSTVFAARRMRSSNRSDWSCSQGMWRGVLPGTAGPFRGVAVVVLPLLWFVGLVREERVRTSGAYVVEGEVNCEPATLLCVVYVGFPAVCVLGGCAC
ncbi:hypothetical protein TraAM80_10046 [Trypanosoma rangeli]|uniref:Uncharacterized protein n=1 Tax=Trypanosoma rangeli TaxID=5698 RepID=A0A3R7JRZ9_TRYRA|nr:uncharacterized protein TraAM80_10046 [Trypanosoma rangeli]RNE95938.1 hypothetical protein TraAM80_10046 [Trypanosoma rangeli]|eukprot:RNE95938.1 hypothetical protein TraAM80_10046 [Trypanosoma rangeli]